MFDTSSRFNILRGKDIPLVRNMIYLTDFLVCQCTTCEKINLLFTFMLSIVAVFSREQDLHLSIVVASKHCNFNSICKYNVWFIICKIYKRKLQEFN